MASLNIRGVSGAALQKLRAEAVGRGLTLREWCLRKLEVWDGDMGSRLAVESGAVCSPSDRGKDAASVVADKSAEKVTIGCRACGSLVGHQKWCSLAGRV